MGEQVVLRQAADQDVTRLPVSPAQSTTVPTPCGMSPNNLSASLATNSGGRHGSRAFRGCISRLELGIGQQCNHLSAPSDTELVSNVVEMSLDGAR